MTAPERVGELSAQRRALIAQRLRRVAVAAAPERSVLPRLPAGSVPPVSFSQERLWFMEQLNPGTTAYVMRAAVRLRGRLDLEALRAALDDLAARHDSLRMCFPASDDGRPLVRVAERVSIPLRYVPLLSLIHI